MLVAVTIGLLTSLLVPGLVFSQSETAIGKPKPEVSLLLQPEKVVEGVPQAFTFVLTNISGEDLRLPEPDIDCGNPTSQGAIWLDESWQPTNGTGLGKGLGTCDFGGSSLPPVPVTERAQKWRLLRTGESIYITASCFRLHYETPKPGTYTFSATYLPPLLSSEDLQLLKRVGIVVPQQKALSASIQYRK